MCDLDDNHRFWKLANWGFNGGLFGLLILRDMPIIGIILLTIFIIAFFEIVLLIPRKELIADRRHVAAAGISVLGAFVAFCPNIPAINHWYSDHFFGPLTKGVAHLSSFETLNKIPKKIIEPVKIEGDDRQFFWFK